MTEPFMGVQLGSHSVFDEGADHCLDVLQNEGGINTVCVYSHTYQGFFLGRQKESLAHDHGVDVMAPEGRNMTWVWAPPNEKYYQNTVLRHKRSKQEEYGDRDVFAELEEPVRNRGMKLYARVLEGHGAHLPNVIDNWAKVMSTDVYGRLHHFPCVNNPDYRLWWLSTVEDLFKSYPLDGFKYGAERTGPITNLLLNGVPPGCFCDHCRKRGQAQGIHVDRAQKGFQELDEFINGLLNGKSAPVDGVFITFLRIILNYPEILAWEKLWHDSKEEIAKLMYGAIKAIKPEAQVGWHLYHNGTSWLPFHKAATDYKEMVSYSDWLKPVFYHDIAGARIHRDVGKICKTVLQEISEQKCLDLLYAIMGYDPEMEPSYESLLAKGLSPDYVYRQTKQCVTAVENQIPIYPGLGFDVPWYGERLPSDSDKVYHATMKAFEAGASGLVVSREYDEMRLNNLRAVKRGLQDFMARKS